MTEPKIKRVYKLMGDMSGIASVAMSRLKVSRFKELNDPFELLGVNLGDPKLRKVFQRTRNEIDKDKGMHCFTTDWRNPLMWGHYAENHRGRRALPSRGSRCLNTWPQRRRMSSLASRRRRLLPPDSSQ